MMAVDRYSDKQVEHHHSCDASASSAHSYNTTEDASRKNQPASLSVTTTCTTLQRPSMRHSSRLAQLGLNNKKIGKSNAKLISILGPLVAYCMFQVAANLLMTHDDADIQSYCEQHTLSSKHHSPFLRPFGKPTRVETQHQHNSAQSDINSHSYIVESDINQLVLVRSSQALSKNEEAEQQVYHQRDSRCTSTAKSRAEYIPSQLNLSRSCLLSKLLSTTAQIFDRILRALERPIFYPKVLIAEAAVNHGLLNLNHREIIVLNSTNFITELIQHAHPFPHLKLIEYYLSYCNICLKFKPTYTELAREIFPWRNVIRVASIDLGVSSNQPIARSWSVDIVPTLRVHPPPNEETATQLAKQLISWSSKLNSFELHQSMYEEYKGANLSVKSLIYTHDAKKSIFDKKIQLKSDLIQYIENYVRENQDNLPSTWPNMLSVREKSLQELCANHPRHELFLIIESSPRTNESNQSTMAGQLKMQAGLSVMLELSSSASWKAIRYVRAVENRELIEDVIAHKKRELSDDVHGGQTPESNEQIDLLENLISNRRQIDNNNNVVLVHIDFAHLSLGQNRASLSKFSFITVVTSSDLTLVEQSTQYEQQQQQQNGIGDRAKRAINQTKNSRPIAKRSLFGSASEEEDSASLRRKIDLITLYINQSYTETKEDRKFVIAISKLDDDPTSSKLKEEVADVSREIRQSTLEQTSSKKHSAGNIDSRNAINLSNGQAGNGNNSLISLINRASDSLVSLTTSNSSNTNNLINDRNVADDYEDKLKAIRYIFFQEVPRKSIADKSLGEKQEKLNTLLNLVAVIKTYFPLPDAASVQFIDGIQGYLLRQQQSLLNSVQTSNKNVGFDTNALRQELKRLEVEGKRLPEIKAWKHCKSGGYPCALWRLFHTLTAFEYVKLSQVNQRSTGPSYQVVKRLPAQISSQNQLTQNQKDELQPTAALLSSTREQDQHNSPVERLISPPSTTTSLSLTIATPVSSQSNSNNNNSNSKRQPELDLLPAPVILVMRDYVTQFFSCEDCSRKFRHEAEDLSFERIRQREPAEFSVLWLWETHNRVSKRLSINPETNPPEHPKKWFPSYNQCQKCYNKPPSFLKETNLELPAIFHESIEWNRGEILSYLLCQYTRQPMDNLTNIFGYQVPHGVVVIVISALVLITLLRCASCYIERQRRYKASLLNGNGYSMELQRNC